MAKVVTIYRTPRDVEAFDAYYFGTHLPLVKGIPGLRRCVLSRGEVHGVRDPSGVHRVETLEFDSIDAIEQAFSWRPGLAAEADVANFARESGAEILIFEEEQG